jgi:uncharacterized protein YybS (DUF2232 family)
MNDNHPPANWADRAVAVGAGLATAMIFAASTRGTGLAMALAYFAPLPLMIGALGFSAIAALAGTLLGAVLLAHFSEPALGVAFFLAFGAPALIAGALARRPFAVKSGESAPLPQFLQPGALLAIVLALSVTITWIGVAVLIQHYKGFDAAFAGLLERFREPLDQVVASLKQMSPELEGDTIKRLMLLSAPAGVAASQTLLLAVNLWLAARAVDISGRLGRPWPALPENLILPRVVAAAFVLASGLSFKGGMVGALAGALAAASGLCLAIQGLATLHALSRNAKFRGALLSALYAVVFVLEPWSILLLALFGLVESVFTLRARRARRLSKIV